MKVDRHEGGQAGMKEDRQVGRLTDRLLTRQSI